MNILDEIIAHKKKEIKGKEKEDIIFPQNDISPPRGFRAAIINDPGVSIIAEVKKASPSKGLICPDFRPVEIALDYERGGARAVSVLTDEKFFQGKLEYLVEIRKEINLPVLRKDFIIHHLQVEESASFGADAILIIAACLELNQMKELMAHTKEKGMDYLLEVHDSDELEMALSAKADLIGVNNRNLKDFSVSLNTTFQIKKIVGDMVPIVSESGISGPDEIRKLKECGISAALIGESVVKAKDRSGNLSILVKAGRDE